MVEAFRNTLFLYNNYHTLCVYVGFVRFLGYYQVCRLIVSYIFMNIHSAESQYNLFPVFCECFPPLVLSHLALAPKPSLYVSPLYRVIVVIC